MKTTVHTCACGEHAWFAVTRGYVCFVDTQKAPAFSCWSWHVQINHGNVYAARTQNSKCNGCDIGYKVYVHNVILPLPPQYVVDHVDGDGLNNRCSNLQPITSAGNSQKQKPKLRTKSGYRGVKFDCNKWSATIQHKRRQIVLGRFATAEAAAERYNEAARELHGPQAYVNLIGRPLR